MELDQSQKNTVASWVNQGDTIAQIQEKLLSELDVSMTYMEVRFLIDDLGLALIENETNQPPVNEISKPSVQDELIPTGSVSLTLDKVMRPGTLVSGSVTFSDGATSAWQLDQMGRIGLVPEQENYKPSQEDLEQFQKALQEELQKSGF